MHVCKKGGQEMPEHEPNWRGRLTAYRQFTGSNHF